VYTDFISARTFKISDVLNTSVAGTVLCAIPCKNTVQYDALTFLYGITGNRAKFILPFPGSGVF